MATAYPTHSFVNSNKGKPLLVIDECVFQQSDKATMATSYWACQFIACLQGEEVIFRQLSLKLKAGSQKR
jgi:hypothetical protein